MPPIHHSIGIEMLRAADDTRNLSVEEGDSRTLDELQRLLQARYNITASDTTISRVLNHTLKLTRKKHFAQPRGN